MGTFERIRKISPYFFGAFAVLLIAYFVISDADLETVVNMGSNPQTAAIAIVNGEKILYSDFEERVRQLEEQQRMQMEQQNPGAEIELDFTQLRRQVWDAMLEEILIKQEAKKAGIFIPDKAVAELILQNPPENIRRALTDSLNNFRRDIYVELITNPDSYGRYLPQTMAPEEREKAINMWRMDLVRLGEYYHQAMITEALKTTVTSAAFVLSPEYLRSQYIAENSKAHVKYIFFDLRSVDNTKIEISDNEIRDYYNQNKRFYKEKPKRSVKYLTFRIVPSAEDSVRISKRIVLVADALAQYVEAEKRDSVFEAKLIEFGGTTSDFTPIKDIPENKLEYLNMITTQQVIGPVRLNDGTYFFRLDGRRSGENVVVRAKHILFRFGDNKDSSKAIAQGILARARAGEDFGQLARNYSEDPGSATKGGDLGYFAKEDMVPEFSDAAFAASVGQIVGPVESQFGYHLIKVEDKQADEIKYSELKLVPTVTGTTKNKLLRDAWSLKMQIEEDKIPFDTLSKRIGIQLSESPFVENTRAILGSRYLTDLAFDGKVGDVLEPLELPNYGIVVAQISGEKRGGIADLEDVKNDIKTKLITRKSLDLLKPQAESVYEKVKHLPDISMVQDILPELKALEAFDVVGTGNVPGVGEDHPFVYAVFNNPTDKIIGPIRGEKGYFIIQTVSQARPDKEQIQSEMPFYSSTMKKTNLDRVYYQWFNQIKEDANIDDQRRMFYREY